MRLSDERRIRISRIKRHRTSNRNRFGSRPAERIFENALCRNHTPPNDAAPAMVVIITDQTRF